MNQHTYKNSETPPPIMQGSPPPPEHRITLENWDRPPFNRWSFQHVREVLPTAPVKPGGAAVRQFGTNSQDFSGLDVELFDGEKVTLEELFDRTYTDGFLVIHRGEVVYERYFNGMEPDTLHLSQSVAKSFCAVLAGILIGRGVIDPDAPLQEYVPEFARCGYGTASLRHCLDMRSGVKFAEAYTDPDSHMGALDVAAGWKPKRAADNPDTVFDMILGLEQDREHGGPFEYRSIETDAMVIAMERATDEKLTDLVSREIWRKMGAEFEANFTVDASGYALGCGGLSAALRDYGRFGQMMLDGGRVDGEQVVPADFVARCSQADATAFAGYYKEFYPNGAYGNKFWMADASHPAFMARGVFGQLIHINPQADMVTVKLSSWPDFLNPILAWNTANAVTAITRELTGQEGSKELLP